MADKIILACLDGSQEAEAALPYAAALAAVERAAVQLVAVVEAELDDPLFWRDGEDTEWLQTQRQSAERYLGAKVSALSGQGLDASSVVASGKAAEAILRVAGAADVTTIVMATHGRGGLQRWVLGSVADKVMRMSHCPTLLVRPPSGTEPQSAVALRRLAVPLDGSPLAEHALAPAIEIAGAAGAELLIVRVEQWVATDAARWGGEVGYAPNLDEIDQAIATDAQAYLAGVRQRLPSSIHSEAFLLRGYPQLELEAFFDRRQVDLVIMTTHARSGLPRLVLGSTADRLVRDGFPTLLIHPAETAAGD